MWFMHEHTFKVGLPPYVFQIIAF